MPQYYLIPKRVARAAPALGRAVQWLEAQLFRLIFFLVERLSVERASNLGARVFGLTGRFNTKRDKVLKNLEIAFPDTSAAEREALCREIFSNLGRSAAELVKLRSIWDQADTRLEYDIHPDAQAHIDSGKAAVWVTAHVGAWQVANLICKHGDFPMAAVYARESNPYLHDLFYALREGFGTSLIPSDAGVRPLLRALNGGTSLALATDTRLDTGALLPYFGVEALTNTSAARMALRAGTVLIPAHCIRLGNGRFRIVVEAPLKPANPDASIDDQATELSAQVNRRFEAWIRETPGEWMCLKRRWPKAHKL